MKETVSEKKKEKQKGKNRRKKAKFVSAAAGEWKSCELIGKKNMESLDC